MTETIPQMRARHRREIATAISDQAALRITQTAAAKHLGVSMNTLNNIIVRNGLFWPVKRQGRSKGMSQ